MKPSFDTLRKVAILSMMVSWVVILIGAVLKIRSNSILAKEILTSGLVLGILSFIALVFGLLKSKAKE
jgi:hypothetical protein